MKKISFALVALGLVVAVASASCKKDNPPPGGSGGPANPNVTGNAAVNAVPLSGGTVLGRWSSELYYTEYFLNNVFQSSQIDSVQVGEEVIEFMGGGMFNLYLDTMLFETGTYTASSNQLHLDLSSGDQADFTYGVTNTKMRWREIESHTDSLGIHKYVDDILFVRY